MTLVLVWKTADDITVIADTRSTGSVIFDKTPKYSRFLSWSHAPSAYRLITIRRYFPAMKQKYHFHSWGLPLPVILELGR